MTSHRMRAPRNDYKRSALVDKVFAEFPHWPPEVMTARRGVADLYRMVYGPRSARWIMPKLGFPKPPTSTIDLGRQLTFDFVRGGTIQRW